MPKATFLKGLCGMWGFNSVILPKNAGKKTSQVTSLPGPKPWGNPSRAGSDADREQTKEKSELSGYPAVPEPNCRDSLSALCIQKAANTWVSVSVIYPGTCLPGYQHSCNMLTCPSNLKRLYFIFSYFRLPRLSKANLIRSPSKDTHPRQKIHIPWEQTKLSFIM